jgi:hypothetical protein
MAIIPNGITGPFIGRVGSVVGYVSRGKAIMRSRPNFSKSRKFSIPQQQQHAKFSLMNKYLGPIIPFLNATKKTGEVDLTGYNKAFSYNVKNAIAGSYPNLTIAYNMVLLSRGDLPNVQTPSIRPVSGGQIQVSWPDNSGTGMARRDDKLFVAVFCENLNNHWITVFNLTDRSAGNCFVNASLFRGQQVHIYIGFLSAGGDDVSDSLYVGAAQVE